MKKLFRGIVNLLVDDWQVAMDSIKGGSQRHFRIDRLLILGYSIAE